MRQKLCFVSAHLPDPNSKQAGQRIAYGHLKCLSNNYDIILISFANEFEISDYNEENYSFCKEKKIVCINNLTRIKKTIENIDIPFYISFRKSKEIEIYIDEFKEKMVFWLEYSQMGIYISNIQKKALQIIIVCHDVLIQMFERKLEHSFFLKFFYFMEKKRILKFEKRTLEKCNKVIVLSKKDKTILSDNYKLNNLIVLIPSIALKVHKKNYERNLKERIIVFFGAMNRVENETAILYFVKHIYEKLLLMKFPVKFIIIGSNPSGKMKELSYKYSNIIVTGFVKDPYELFSQAWFAVAPIRLGAGIKMKVIECLAFGLPVIATSVGAEGIEATEENGLIIVDETDKYLEKCKQMLIKREECLRLGENAKNWFSNVYIKEQETEKKICEIAGNF